MNMLYFIPLFNPVYFLPMRSYLILKPKKTKSVGSYVFKSSIVHFAELESVAYYELLKTSQTVNAERYKEQLIKVIGVLK